MRKLLAVCCIVSLCAGTALAAFGIPTGDTPEVVYDPSTGNTYTQVDPAHINEIITFPDRPQT